jgi:hypothetical protein
VRYAAWAESCSRFVYAVYRRCLTVFLTEAQRHGGNRKAVFPAAAAESRVRSISVAPCLCEKTCHAQSCEESCSAVCRMGGILLAILCMLFIAGA